MRAMFEKWKIYQGLNRLGILGINQRNADYILRYNPRRLFPVVDDKLLTKQLAQTKDIPVPTLYAVIDTEHDIRKLPQILASHEELVIKPARGSGGEGIIVIKGRKKEFYQTVSNQLLSQAQIEEHISDILSGLYSLNGQEDKVIFEYKVNFDTVFDEVSYQGVPDIRTIIFKGYPVMAMLRLPTQESNGKANLHQGGIGVGIDLLTGSTTYGLHHNKRIIEHPDTGYPVPGLIIPHWQKILELSAKCYDVTGLGYIGVDIVLDKTLGPLLLELNARPGLNIQMANRAGLLPRLRLIEDLNTPHRSLEERLRFSLKHFAANLPMRGKNKEMESIPALAVTLGI